MIKLFVALVIGLGPSVWAPGRDCEDVFRMCLAMERHRAFVQYMTGPGGNLIVVVRRSANGFATIEIDPSDLYPVRGIDLDTDGDVDLRDWRVFQNYPRVLRP